MESDDMKIVRLAKEWESALAAAEAGETSGATPRETDEAMDREEGARRELITFLRLVRENP